MHAANTDERSRAATTNVVSIPTRERGAGQRGDTGRRPSARRLWAVLLGLVLSVSACSACTNVAIWRGNEFDQTATPASPGVNVSFLQWDDGSTQDAILDQVRNAGTQWLRIDMNWNYVEPNPGQWHWGDSNGKGYDHLIFGARARGLHIALTLDYPVPGWANGWHGNYVPPSNVSDYGTYAFAAAARYTPWGVTSYEIWNEPNNSLFFRNPDPAKYTGMLKSAYLYIKAISRGNTVISGALAPEANSGGDYNQPDFLNAIYDKGARGFFDAVGDNPYTFPTLANDRSRGVKWGGFYWLIWNGSWSIRSIMNNHGDGGKQVWAMEYGASVGGMPCGSTCWPDSWETEDEQATQISCGLLTFSQQPWAGPMFIFDWQDNTSLSASQGAMGLLRGDGSARPSYFTFADWAQNHHGHC
jgi:hypothetical protein